MERQTVDSSNLISIGYDEKTKKLEVEFKGGTIYQYDGVEPESWEEFKVSPSKGQFFHQTIKNRYTFKKVDQLK